MNEEEWKKFITSEKSKEKIGVELALARRYVGNIIPKYMIWQILNNFVFIIITITVSFIFLKFPISLIFSFIYLMIYFSSTGNASISPSKELNLLFYLSVVGIIIFFISNLNFIPLILMLISLFSISLFYNSLGNFIIESSLKDYKIFKANLEEGIIAIRTIQ